MKPWMVRPSGRSTQAVACARMPPKPSAGTRTCTSTPCTDSSSTGLRHRPAASCSGATGRSSLITCRQRFTARSSARCSLGGITDADPSLFTPGRSVIVNCDGGITLMVSMPTRSRAAARSTMRPGAVACTAPAPSSTPGPLTTLNVISSAPTSPPSTSKPTTVRLALSPMSSTEGAGAKANVRMRGGMTRTVRLETRVPICADTVTTPGATGRSVVWPLAVTTRRIAESDDTTRATRSGRTTDSRRTSALTTCAVSPMLTVSGVASCTSRLAGIPVVMVCSARVLPVTATSTTLPVSTASATPSEMERTPVPRMVTVTAGMTPGSSRPPRLRATPATRIVSPITGVAGAVIRMDAGVSPPSSTPVRSPPPPQAATTRLATGHTE